MEQIQEYVIESMQYKMLPEYTGKYKPYHLEFKEEYIPVEVGIISINKEFSIKNRRFNRGYKRKNMILLYPIIIIF